MRSDYETYVVLVARELSEGMTTDQRYAAAHFLSQDSNGTIRLSHLQSRAGCARTWTGAHVVRGRAQDGGAGLACGRAR
jgi:hypothetical protein